MMERNAAREPTHRSRLYASYLTLDPAAALAGDLAPYYRKNILPHLPAARTSRIVDIACGAGALVAFLRDCGYLNVYGVDRSAEQVAAAHAAHIAGVEQGDAFALLARNSGIDAILAVDLLEHLAKDEALDLLGRTRSALRPGGRIVVQTCNAASPMFGRIRYGDLTHETAYTDRSLAQAMRAAGLRPVAMHGIDPAVHGARSFARAAAWHCAKVAARAYLAAETGVVRGHIVSQNLIGVGERPMEDAA